MVVAVAGFAIVIVIAIVAASRRPRSTVIVDPAAVAIVITRIRRGRGIVIVRLPNLPRPVVDATN